MATPSAPLRLGRDELGDARHICALFEGTEDATRFLFRSCAKASTAVTRSSTSSKTARSTGMG